METMSEPADHSLHEYVTAVIGGQLFGLPILRVQDVFAPERLTQVPLAPHEIAGVLNLRGRIVTLIDMRHRLGLGRREEDHPAMAIGVESRGESYGLLIDSVKMWVIFAATCLAGRRAGYPAPRIRTNADK